MERVGTDVLILILQCLSPRHRLTAACRLSRAFHALRELAFPHGSAASCLPDVVDPGKPASGKNNELRSLTLNVREAEATGRSTLFTCPRSLRSLPGMAALVTVRIDVLLPDSADRKGALRCVLRSALSLPLLQTLSIDGYQLPAEHPEADWTDSALPSPASLRHLSLRGLLLSAASVLRICSLPAQSLRLEYCRLLAATEQTVGGSSSTAALSSLSRPDCDGSVLRLQPPFSRGQQSGAQLRELRCVGRLNHRLLRLVVSQAQQLRCLDVRDCELELHSEDFEPALVLSGLVTAAGAPRLRRLTTLRLLSSGIHGNGRHWPQRDRAFIASSLRLVAAYSAQLTTLSVDVSDEHSINPWFRALAARCRQLENFSMVMSSWYGPPVELQLEPAPGEPVRMLLPRLTQLHLLRVPLSAGSLLSLFRLCPELRRSYLLEMPRDSYISGEAAQSCCPKLEPWPYSSGSRSLLFTPSLPLITRSHSALDC